MDAARLRLLAPLKEFRTGLSGSGKSTISVALERALAENQARSYFVPRAPVGGWKCRAWGSEVQIRWGQPALRAQQAIFKSPLSDW